MVASFENYSSDHDHERYEPVRASRSIGDWDDNRSLSTGSVPVVPPGQSAHRSRRTGETTQYAHHNRRNTSQTLPHQFALAVIATALLLITLVLIAAGMALLD
jgi:hypothetical protein